VPDADGAVPLQPGIPANLLGADDRGLLTQQQLADELQVSMRTLERWRQEGTGPAFVRVGRSLRYRRSDIDAWLERQRRSQGE
jgi:excisionase family DNA binding protein